MGQLTRTSAKLLKQVGKQPHAGDDDHHVDEPRTSRRNKRRANAEVGSSLPTPPGTISAMSSQNGTVDLTAADKDNDADLYADPEDLEDLEASPKSDSSIEISATAGKSFRRLDNPSLHTAGEDSIPRTKFKVLDVVGNTFEDQDEERAEPGWLPPFKRRKTSGKSEHVNIHAKPPSSKKSGSVRITYGSSSQKENAKSPTRFKAVKKDLVRKTSPKRKQFKKLDAIGSSEETGLPFKVLGDLPSIPADGESSSSLSDAPSCVEAEDVAALDLPEVAPYVVTVDCVCGQPVSKLLKEQFEDEVNTRKIWTFRWQTRFCAYHKRHQAQEVWEERGYPQIDWSGLERRMRRHDGYLLSVLDGTTDSNHRRVLKAKLKPGRKAVQQSYNAEHRPGASVGYYGPRGEKMMIDHIMNCLSDDIREQATKDKLVASSGVQGGVTGFVQAVLVPHLAELLIKDDYGLKTDWEPKVRELITDSAELGELMHPETEDQIFEIDDVLDDE